MKDPHLLSSLGRSIVIWIGIIGLWSAPTGSVAMAGDGPAGASFAESLGIELIEIPSGEFLMGSTEAEIDRILHAYPENDRQGFEDEGPQHPVRISKPFLLGRTEVTVGQFRRFVEETGYRTDAERDGEGRGWSDQSKQFETAPRYSWRDPGFDQAEDHPVVNVSWNDAVAFCEWLSRREGRRFDLPSEAQWEYACRAGSTSLYPGGAGPDASTQWANIPDASAQRRFPDWTTAQGEDGYVFTAPVGSFPDNAFGVNDLIGNAWEWCRDGFEFDYYQRSPIVDPPGAEVEARAVRGGGWFSYGGGRSRAACRCSYPPTMRSYDLGFRVVTLMADAEADSTSTTDAKRR